MSEFKLEELKKFIVGVIVVLPLMQLSWLEQYMVWLRKFLSCQTEINQGYVGFRFCWLPMYADDLAVVEV